jgi:hypothetical protein
VARGRGHSPSFQLGTLRAGQQIPRKQCDDMAWALGTLEVQTVKPTLAPHVPASTEDCCEMHTESAKESVKAKLNWGAPPSRDRGRAVQLQPGAAGATRRERPSAPAGRRDPKQRKSGTA